MTPIELADRVLKQAPFQNAEVTVSIKHRLLTRFGDNRITQNVDQESVSLGIRAYEVKSDDPGLCRTARVDCNDVSETGISAALLRLQEALSVLPWSKTDGEVAALAQGPQKYEKVKEVEDPFLRSDLSDEAASAIEKSVAAAKSRGMTASGTYAVEFIKSAFVNSRGIRASQTMGDCEFAVTLDKESGAGRGFSHTVSPGELDVDAAIARAVERCERSVNPDRADAGAYDVVLEPAAFAELLVFMGWIGLSGKAYLEERSFCRGKLGKQLCDERISLIDLPLDPRVGGAAYDGQGISKHNVTFVERGVLKELALDGKTAARMNRAPTGHGSGEPNGSDPVPWNLSFEFAGDRINTDQMVSRVKRGIYVTQFHYTNVVDVMEGILTGMTRNGTFLIENGKITKPIKNLRFTQALLPFLNSIEAASPEMERVTAFFGGSSLCPAVLARAFQFTSVTDF